MSESIGNMLLDEANSMNVPVCIFITEPEGSETSWSLTANNYMPRKNFIAEGEYHYIADSRTELQELINLYVVPLYRAALSQLETNGELYYWELKKDGE